MYQKVGAIKPIPKERRVTISLNPVIAALLSFFTVLGGTSHLLQEKKEDVSKSSNQQKKSVTQKERIPQKTSEHKPKEQNPKHALTQTYVVTAYTAGPESTGKTSDDPGFGITASGSRVKRGVTAACPPYMPFGTVIEIEGVGQRVCEDRGGAIKGKRIDVYYQSLQTALEFGRQELEVKIIKEG